MPTNLIGRCLTILAVILVALWALFPNAVKMPFGFGGDHPLKPELRAGIDMVGGSRLVYEIQAPRGETSTDLVQRVAAALKQRVDPDGVKNLIWRPQGATRLEIQMPLTASSEESKPKRQAYEAASDRLNTLNITRPQLLAALELQGEARQSRLAELAMGSPRRAELLAELTKAQDAKNVAAAAQDAVAQATAETKIDSLIEELPRTNLSAASLQDALEIAEPAVRDSALITLRQNAAGFDARLKAIDEFQTAHAAWATNRNNLDDTTELKRLLRGSGVLSFHLLAVDATPQEQQQWAERLNTDGPRQRVNDRYRWIEIAANEVQSLSSFARLYNNKAYALVWNTPEKSMVNREGLPKWALVRAGDATSAAGKREVSFQFDATGANLFSSLTGRFNASTGTWLLAAVLDDKIISAPRINQQIGGQGVISGGDAGFSQKDQTDLIKILSAGSLPAQLTADPITEETVGPQLGESNLKRGLYSCLFGVVIVAFFLISYYYRAGVVAFVAVLLNLLMILAGMAMFNASFTLPGVAGIILTIGMAVDANVLIFERLREEQQRGLSLRMALRNAYDRAATAIWDSNTTTAITALILYLIGTEEVKGFGLTLLLGLISSLFTSLYVTKTIFAIMIEKFDVQKLGSLPLSIPRWDEILRPKINWMKLAPKFAVVSVLFIVVGLGLFFWQAKKGLVLDTEFAGGTNVTFDLKTPSSREEVQKKLETQAAVLPAIQVQSVGSEQKTYTVVTVNDKANEVRSAISTALSGELQTTQSLSFASSTLPLSQAMGSLVVPLERETQTIGGGVPRSIGRHLGGVAVLIRNLSADITADEVRQRVEQFGTQGASSSSLSIDVEALIEGNGYLVLASSPSYAYDRPGSTDYQTWLEGLATPMWERVTQSLATPGELQRVSTIGEQVAGEALFDATLAMILSILFIVIFIWVRFGDVRFGTATIVACLHDLLFVLAALGFAQLFAETALGRAILLEPFRINLTMVAALLTVMGYSMNDTVVVFDRVRELRGKVGIVDQSVMNNAINQTLSRTLLTGGTTILTIFVMYLFGGPGIHGFTFAMLVGLVAGTYSSIAVASPFVLLGQRLTSSRLERSPTPARA